MVLVKLGFNIMAWVSGILRDEDSVERSWPSSGWATGTTKVPANVTRTFSDEDLKGLKAQQVKFKGRRKERCSNLWHEKAEGNLNNNTTFGIIFWQKHYQNGIKKIDHKPPPIQVLRAFFKDLFLCLCMCTSLCVGSMRGQRSSSDSLEPELQRWTVG